MEMILSRAGVCDAGKQYQRLPWWRRIISAGYYALARIENRGSLFVSGNGEKTKETLFTGQRTENSRNEEYSRNAERLLNDFGNAVLRLSYSYLHNMSDAEDVLQETLIRYLKTQPELLDHAHEKAWLLRVAANLSKNRLEYNRLRDTDELEETLVSQEREDLSFLWEAVKKLPHTSRDVIHLFYYEGYPTAQIARILNRRENTVRSDLLRGRERLKKILKEEYDFE